MKKGPAGEGEARVCPKSEERQNIAPIWTVKPARPSHVARIAKRMRAVDQAECAAVGSSPKAALRSGLRISTFALTVLCDDRPVAMLGVAPGNVMEGVGVPWLLATDEALKAGRQFATWGPKIVAAMCSEWPRLENYVGAENVRAIRVLRRLGFDLDRELVIVGGLKMRRFSLGGQ